jgi:hypothetical protein
MNQSPNLNRSWEESQTIIKNLEAEVAQLKEQLIQKSCGRHIIDPSKMRILLWINRHKDGKPNTCVLKIAEQRLLGLPRSDRRGETYWRFDELLEKSEVKDTPPAKLKCLECQAEMEIIGDASQTLPLAWQKCLDCSAEKEARKVQKAEQKAQNISPNSQDQAGKETNANQ